MLLMSPMFLFRREKYASGFWQRLGNYPEFNPDLRPVIWLHCVSVGETNAARPLVDELLKTFHSHRLIISTTTKTGQDLARKIFADKADAVFYFPFDWKFTVQRALKQFRPTMILLMETEIWPRLIVEGKRSGAALAIVNGRLSHRSFERYRKVLRFVGRVLQDVDLTLMQSEKDAERLNSLGISPEKTSVTGNLKFDLSIDQSESELTELFRRRFRHHRARPVIVAASTHEPEERLILESLQNILPHHAKLFIVPRHPQRFVEVFELLKTRAYRVARRSDPETEGDPSSDIILLDSIGELRALYPLADIVFVGGSLIPHGGQSILEPAAAGRAIVTGPYTFNFDDAIKTFLASDALIQLAGTSSGELARVFDDLLHDPAKRAQLGINALEVISANRGAAVRTVTKLKELSRLR
jgi:3-deoxy-D-manno-octulosonic-acid transferase